MKYKTLFRLAMKVIGVIMILHGAGAALAMLLQLVSMYAQTRDTLSIAGMNSYFIAAFGVNAGEVALGIYFFSGAKWVVDRAIPSNRPYCHECGYDLTGAAGSVCNECGTPLEPVQISAARRLPVE